jgi:hypothetical protein
MSMDVLRTLFTKNYYTMIVSTPLLKSLRAQHAETEGNPEHRNGLI